jgi:hypothetical protein
MFAACPSCDIRSNLDQFGHYVGIEWIRLHPVIVASLFTIRKSVADMQYVLHHSWTLIRHTNHVGTDLNNFQFGSPRGQWFIFFRGSEDQLFSTISLPSAQQVTLRIKYLFHTHDTVSVPGTRSRHCSKWKLNRFHSLSFCKRFCTILKLLPWGEFALDGND